MEIIDQEAPFLNPQALLFEFWLVNSFRLRSCVMFPTAAAAAHFTVLLVTSGFIVKGQLLAVVFLV